MDEKKYKKRIEFQEKMISRKNEQIESLELRIQNLELKCKEKDNIIDSITHLRNELNENIDKTNKHKEEYKELIYELKKMKEILNQTVYKGRWKLIKFLIK